MGDQGPDTSRMVGPHAPHLLNRIASGTKSAGRTAGPLLIFTCVCFALAYRYRKKRSTGPSYSRSLSMAAIHGGKVTIQRLLDSQHVSINPAALDEAEKQFEDLLKMEPPNFFDLQSAAAKLEMSGKEAKAVEALNKAYEKAKKEGKQHEAHEIQMLLVEMLIYKGDYKDALKCKCLREQVISDARCPLYQAIIHIILEDEGSAKTCFTDFLETRRKLDLSDSAIEGNLYEVATNFDKLKKTVDGLKKEIEKATKKSA